MSDFNITFTMDEDGIMWAKCVELNIYEYGDTLKKAMKRFGGKLDRMIQYFSTQPDENLSENDIIRKKKLYKLMQGQR